jgi:DNA-binding response OmpR family regulator
VEKILVIEDDRAVQRALKRLFESEGYAVECSYDGTSGLEAFRASPPSIIILDLRLPGMTGTEICREIKQALPNLPVIVLSAAADVADKVLLLELGADDYVTKPFSPRELLARIHAAMRHGGLHVTTAQLFSFDDVTVDFTRMQVTRSGHPVACTPREFKILKFFSDNVERVVSRDELLNQVWGYEAYDRTRTVDNHIMKLRQKIERNPASPIHFRTVHGVGYKFVK